LLRLAKGKRTANFADCQACTFHYVYGILFLVTKIDMTIVKTPHKRTTSTHRKRTAAHHRRNHEYGKAYWPYLPMVAIVSLGILLNSWMGSIHHQVLSYATDISVQGLLDGTNNERTGNGLGSLRLNAQLSQAAQAKAADMVADNYWAHTSPSGKTPWTFINAAGYSYTTAGENLAYGFATSSETIAGWMNSPGHRANILNTSYRDVGFGIINAENYQSNGNQTIVVAMYAAPYSTSNSVAQSPTTTQGSSPVTGSSQSSGSAGGQEQASPQPAAEQTETAVEKKQDTATPVSTTTRGSENNTDTSETKPISRIQVITAANVAWTQFALSMLVSVAILIFLLRHSFAWHKFLVRGERFVLHHPLLDIAFVAIATLGTVLLQTAGFIR
jgi:hypothetical protein